MKQPAPTTTPEPARAPAPTEAPRRPKVTEDAASTVEGTTRRIGGVVDKVAPGTGRVLEDTGKTLGETTRGDALQGLGRRLDPDHRP